jgi:hypothetical protein
MASHNPNIEQFSYDPEEYCNSAVVIYIHVLLNERSETLKPGIS